MTHTLVGVLLGECTARATAGVPTALPALARRNALVWLAGIGSNLPDADVIYPLLTGNRLDYLLQHRGYTHTVAGAVLLAGALLIGCEGVLRARRLTPSLTDRLLLGGLALLALLLHLAMDFSNSYGVHPFWPLYNGWIYGDSVFIVEPLLWAAAAPLVFLLRTALARALVVVALLAGCIVPLAWHLAPPALAIGLALLVLLMLGAGRALPVGAALVAGLGAWLAITAVFVAAGRTAAARVEAYATEHFAQARLIDHVLTPMPLDPACWDVLLLQIEGERYIARRALLSLAPRWIPAARCARPAAQGAMALAPVADAGADWLAWRGEVSMPLGRIAALAASWCEAAAFMQFARAPVAAAAANAWLLSDLRFERGGPGFAVLALTAAHHGCPRTLPPWMPPRTELLATAPASAGPEAPAALATPKP